MPAQSAGSPEVSDPVHRVLLAAACAAPSVHTTRPWRFRTGTQADTVEVVSLPVRGPARADPRGQALHLSVGAALFNLRVAAVQLGREPVVRLLPDPGAPDLLATVRLAGRPRASLTRRPDLYQAVWRDRGGPFPFTAEPVSAAVLAELTEAAHQDGATLWVPERSTRVRRPGDRCTLGEEAAHGDGPDLLALATPGDRPADWLRAGQALQHALLILTLHGLRASMLHQTVEWPDLRDRLARSLPHRGTPQLLLRVGHGPVGVPTRRRRPCHRRLGRPSRSTSPSPSPRDAGRPAVSPTNRTGIEPAFARDHWPAHSGPNGPAPQRPAVDWLRCDTDRPPAKNGVAGPHTTDGGASRRLW
ncbi:hypothetical protein ACPC54_38705 [Kitasatospora sp. NPDC094028]